MKSAFPKSQSCNAVVSVPMQEEKGGEREGRRERGGGKTEGVGDWKRGGEVHIREDVGGGAGDDFNTVTETSVLDQLYCTHPSPSSL